MQAILKPISHPELGDVMINDALFSVGRDDEAFAGLPNAHAGRLSRRHARLFEQDGVIYIIDLGSRNGTFVNGQPVATQPHELRSGDLIDFAGQLTYRLDLVGNAHHEAVPTLATSILNLQAVASDDGPDSLVVTAFPFLVSKQADAFAKYQQLAPAELDFLSRRHAHIFRHEGRLFVEDLGSTNGTFVDGRRLGDEPVELCDGQTIAFGGDYFVYRVVLEFEDAPTRILAVAPPADTLQDQSDKTTFVTAATSFLDIFCTDDVAPDTDSGDGPPLQAAKQPGGTGRKPGLLARLGLAPSEKNPTTIRRLILVSVLLVSVVVAAGYWLLQPSATDQMMSLIEEQRYDDALTLARGHEAAGDSGSTMSRLALRALIAKTLPGWLDALEDGRSNEIEVALAAERVPSDSLTVADEYLDLLLLIGDIQAAVEGRGGLEVPLRLFDEETARLERLIEAWESPHPDKRQVTERLLAALPPALAELGGRYQAAYRLAASHIRTLQSKLAVYRPAERQVASLLSTHLAQGRLDRLGAELDRVATRYDQFAGFDRLRQDLAQYRAILDAAQHGRETEAARIAADARFYAAPFAEAAARLAQERLPSGNFLEGFAAALDLWRDGQIDAARGRLTSLLNTPWTTVAQRELDRMVRVATGFDEVQAALGSDVYDDRLVGFFHGLNDDRDRYFVGLLRDEYVQSRERIGKRAQQEATTAAQAWSEYRNQGGISSTQRLEARISKAYTQRAESLSIAADAADRATRAYAHAKIEIPGAQGLLLRAIAQEVVLQHQSLNELQGVLDDVALEKKRALLPGRAE